MESIFLDDAFLYDGSQLRPRFIYEKTGLLGDALLAFVGPCEVSEAHMVDLEDVRQAAWIRSQNMLHLLIELFDVSLFASVAVQRLLIDHMRQVFESFQISTIVRRGDDLYDGIYKLSVSIAAPAKSSSLIHAGLNISSQGTPVPTRGLDDYGISPKDFIDRLVPAFLAEFHSMKSACYKVKEI